MPDVTEHTPKVSTRSVNPYAREFCGKGYSNTDRHTHTDGLSKTAFRDVLMVLHPKSGLYSNSIFCTNANTSIDMEVKMTT